MSDVSGVTNFFSTANEGFVTTLGSSILSGATTVPLTSVSGLTNGSVFVGIIEPGDTKQQVFTGTVDTSGSQITGVVWTRGTNNAHSAGVTIVDYVTGTDHNMMSAGILKEHVGTGLHSKVNGNTVPAGTDTVALLTATQTFTNKSLTAPKVLTAIDDSNGNEVIRTPATASAVNDITVTNATTGNAPTISASGDDTNIWLKAAGKGTGFMVPQLKILTASIAVTGTTEAVAATITVPSVPFATTVLLIGWANAALGSGTPTSSWLNRIRRGTTTAGTNLTGDADNTKSAAAGVSESRITTQFVTDNIAANTSTSYVWTVQTGVSTTTTGQFMALVFAQ